MTSLAMMDILKTAAVVIIGVAVLLGTIVLVAKSNPPKPNRCAAAGGTVVRTPSGRVCARLEVIKP